jgi:hypothetical protein
MGTTSNSHHTVQNALAHKLGDVLTLKVFWDIPSRNLGELQTITQNKIRSG